MLKILSSMLSVCFLAGSLTAAEPALTMDFKDLNENSFDAAIANEKKLVVLDFYAEWCVPCKKMMPIIQDVSSGWADKVVFYKINIDNNRSLSTKFKVQSIPTLIFIKDGSVVGQSIGALSKKDLEGELTKHAK